MSQISLLAEPAVENIELEGADLSLHRNVALGDEPVQVMERLLRETPWRQENITLFGRTHPQPRLLAWYGEEGARYRYSGRTYDPLPFTPLLDGLRSRMESLAGSRFNSVLLNYYRDGRDSMGMHADDEPELGPEPVIASLSLGEVRTLHFRHRRERSRGGLDLPLPDASVLVMRGTTQHHWKHGIRKLRRDCGPRLNLTFRRILPPPQQGTS